jgi:hypothetical protein
MDCSFGHSEFAVDVSQVLKHRIEKKRFPYFRRATVTLNRDLPG